MVLQINRTWLGSCPDGCGGGISFSRQLDVIMNNHPIVANGHPWVLNELAAIVVLGSCEVDVIGLPTERRKTHVEVGLFDGIQASTFVLLTRQSK